MNVEQTLFGDLNGRVKNKFDGLHLKDNSRVFLARKGNKIVGVAGAEYSYFGNERDITVYVKAPETVAPDLEEEVRDQLAYLKHALVFMSID